ncbi:MAG: ROK family protein [Acidobacteriia bacterium]|nr:ROK family protein [Terriglobia bacterium]
MNNFSIGVDLGGTNLRIAVVDEEGHLVEKVTLETKVSLGRDHVINDMCGAIQRLTEKYKNSAALLGIGVGVPGITDLQAGYLRDSPNLPGPDYPVRAEIERRLKTTVVLENDANAAALGEQWLGAAKNFPDMAMLTLGTGVGGALVLGGQIFHGMTGMAGEFGHTTIEPEGNPCGCGNRGCLEQYASATAVVRMAKEEIAGGQALALASAAQSGAEFNAELVYNLAIQGDEAARRVFRRVGRALGIALATLVNSLNLPMHVIGGGVSSAWDAFSPVIFEELRQRSMVYAATAPPDPLSAGQGVSASRSCRKTIVTRAQLGSDAGLYGAARLPMMARTNR